MNAQGPYPEIQKVKVGANEFRSSNPSQREEPELPLKHIDNDSETDFSDTRAPFAMVQVALTELVFDAEHELSVTRAPVLSDDHQDAGYRQQVPTYL